MPILPHRVQGLALGLCGCLSPRALGKAQPGFLGTFLRRWEAAGLGRAGLGPYPSLMET